TSRGQGPRGILLPEPSRGTARRPPAPPADTYPPPPCRLLLQRRGYIQGDRLGLPEQGRRLLSKPRRTPSILPASSTTATSASERLLLQRRKNIQSDRRGVQKHRRLVLG